MKNCTKTIETQRLVLRKFRISDAEDMFYNWANSEKVTKYLTWKAHNNVEETKVIINLWLNEYENTDSYNWAIELKGLSQAIGNIGVVKPVENAEAIIGYVIGEKWWGKGIMTEAFKALIEYLFNETKINTITAFHHIENNASGKVMLKCGLRYISQEENHIDNCEKACTVKKYSITRKEYEMLCLQK